MTPALTDAEHREEYRYFLRFTSSLIRFSTGGAYDLYLESYHHREGIRALPRKRELTFQRGANAQSGRWKKFYRGNAHYLGAGRSKSDIESYRAALEAWKKLKVQLDAELIPVPRAYDSDYDEVIREWELVLAWPVQHGASDEAAASRDPS